MVIEAVALDRVHGYDAVQQEYEELLKDMKQINAEIDDEALKGDIVKPVEEEPIKIPPGG